MTDREKSRLIQINQYRRMQFSRVHIIKYVDMNTSDVFRSDLRSHSNNPSPKRRRLCRSRLGAGYVTSMSVLPRLVRGTVHRCPSFPDYVPLTSHPVYDSDGCGSDCYLSVCHIRLSVELSPSSSSKEFRL